MGSNLVPPTTSPKAAESARLRHLLPVWCLLLLCVWTAFSPILSNGFVDWDDRGWILENHAFQGLGARQIQFAFTTFTGGVYQPLGWLLQSLTYEAYGLDPWGYHFVSLLLHAVNVVLLHLLCVTLLARGMPEDSKRVGGALGWLCGVPVVLYGVHPLRVEPVAWASAQAYLPGITFSLLATLAYLRAHSLRSEFRRAWMVGSYFLVTLAVLTKGSAVVLPFVFLTLDAYPLRRFRLRLWPRRAVWKLLSEKVLILVFCLGFSTLAFLAKWSWVEPEITVQPVPVSRVAQASYAACFYLGKTVWPFGITAFYPRPERGDFWAPEYAASVVAVVFAVALAVWQRAQRPWLSATIFTYLVIASPYLGLARVGIALAADRYSYAPLMVWVVIGCAGLVRLAQRRWSRMLNWAAGAGACIITCGLMALCSNQCRVWGTSELLWAHALAEAEWSSELHRLRGTSLADEGNLEQARAELRESLRLQPGYFEAIYDLGVVLSLSGESDGAVAYLRQAVGMRPGDPRTHMSLGEALARTGQVPEAISSYYRALRFHPSCAEVRFDLGVAFLRQRKVNEAIKQLTEAVTLRPRYTEAHSMLGGAFAIAGRIDDAAAEYDQAVRLDPRNSRLRVELGLTLARQGRSAESIRQLREATIRDRENLEAHHVLGAILASLGRIREAAAEFEEVVRLRPDHKEARAFLERVKGRRM